MNAQRRLGGSHARRYAVALVLVCLVTTGPVWAQGEVGTVTLLAGAPRMVGESMRPLQAILSGRQLETGEADAAGLLIEDIVFHVGANTRVTVLDEPGRKRVVLEQGYVVFYTDPVTQTEIVVETPFGFLTWHPGLEESGQLESGWYAVRHVPERANVSPAVSTYAAIEGLAEVEGTVPVAGPHTLQAGQRWRIVGGQVPGAPVAGDERAAAEELRRTLYRETADMIRTQTADITRLASIDVAPATQRLPFDVVVPEQQFIIDSNAAVQARGPNTVPFIPDPFLTVPDVEIVEPQYAVRDPIVIPAGTPGNTSAGFVDYAGVPADPNWNDFLTAVNGNPAFQPLLLTDFANGGFSYIQLAGPDAEVTRINGETFLATEVDSGSGWAAFTPSVAVGDPGFDPDGPLTAVVTEGFAAIAYGEHLAGGGTIGGDGVDPTSGFAVLSDGNIGLNPSPPAGYPLLNQADDTTGLTVDGQVISDQLAALGAGLNPQLLHELGPQLVFVSNSDTDSQGNGFDFDGQPIQPTNLNLPGDREVQVDATGAVNLATPLVADGENTVGIQFAGQGEVIAVIHHTGIQTPDDESLPTSEHFEVVRGERDSVVQWRDGQRVTGGDGALIETEDLNDDPALRNELFALISEEVNNVIPPDRHTVGGPAFTGVASPLRQLRRFPGRLVRVGDALGRRQAAVRRPLLSGNTRSLRLRGLQSAGGRLVRQVGSSTSRRHLGRVSTRR